MSHARAQPGAAEEPPLPALREDLRLLPGPAAADGSATWTIHDPARQRFFRIGRAGFEALSRWHLGRASRVAEVVRRDTTADLTLEQVGQLARFLLVNNLTLAADPASADRLTQQRRAMRTGPLRWLVHHWLFIRIPLVRPDGFLHATLPIVRLLVGRLTAVALLSLFVLSLFLVSRVWDGFVGTFLYFFSWEGLGLFFCALLVSKIFHELGHAYTAVHYGCRVPSMGVALMVMWPVLYTDTTDTWRLTQRRQRLMVGLAGMAVELALAILATFLWCLLPEGPLRGAVFMMATANWVTSLLINLNPFMRFDGYYLLSDLWGIENLQARSFALGRWKLREVLFGFGEPPPEAVSRRRRRWMILYAYATWIYRFFLFLGIALLVYHVVFKALGVILMLIELIWFIAMPIRNELQEWWRRRKLIRPTLNLALTLAVLSGLVWMTTVPWHDRVVLPAIHRARAYAAIHPPAPARLAAVHVTAGAPVAADQLLFTLEQPDLTHSLAQTETRISLLSQTVARQAANAETLDRLRVVEQELAQARTQRAGLEALLTRLSVHAPIAGHIADLAPALEVGRWLPMDLRLATVVAPAGSLFVAYAPEGDLHRVEIGAEGWFIPENPADPALPVRVLEVAQTASRVLETPYLSADHGGPIAAEPDSQGRPIPVESQYRVVLVPTQPIAAPAQVRTGVIHVRAEARSLADRVWRAGAALLIREFGG